MDEYSEFQKEHPLSSKKLTKKMLAAFLPIFVLASSVGIIGSFFLNIVSAAAGDYVSPVSMLLYFIVIAGIIFVGMYLLQRWYYSTYIKRYYYDCSDQFITIKKGVFTPKEIHVQYGKIQDVYVDQDLIDRFFGLYDVHIASATATSGIEAHIDGVEKDVADEIKQFLLGKIQGGGSVTTQSAPAQVAEPAKVTTTTNATLAPSGEISTNTYPISPAWVPLAVIHQFFISIFIMIMPVYIGLMIGSDADINATVNVTAVMNFLSSSMFYVIVGAVWLFVILCGTAWELAWKKNYYFEFAPDYVLLKTGVFTRKENHLPYRSIQNVTLSQGFIERMFGLATVTIENAAQGMMVQNRGQVASNSKIELEGQPYEKAKELNSTLNTIVSKIGGAAMGQTGL